MASRSRLSFISWIAALAVLRRDCCRDACPARRSGADKRAAPGLQWRLVTSGEKSLNMPINRLLGVEWNQAETAKHPIIIAAIRPTSVRPARSGPDEVYFGICNLPAISYGNSRAFIPNLLRKGCPAKGLGSCSPYLAEAFMIYEIEIWN